MRLADISVISMVLLSCLCHAEITGEHIGWPKFKQWFYHWEHEQLPEGEDWTKCVPDLELYWSRNVSYPNQCSVALNCILRETGEEAKQTLSAIMVLLGFIPTLLALICPTFTESAILSLGCPSLSVLIAFGATGTQTLRISDYVDPLDTIDTTKQPRQDGLFTHLADALRPHRRLAVIMEHVLGLAAAANITHVNLDLGWRSVSSIDCNGSYLPFSWAMVSVSLHVLGMVSFWLTPRGISPATNAMNTCPEITSVEGPETDNEDIHPKAYANHQQQPVNNSSVDSRRVLYTENPSLWTLILQYVTTAYAISHLVYGTVVFSSLMFLTLADAIPVIIRYSVSAVACSMISRYELAAMSQKYRIERVEKVEGQTRVQMWTRRRR